VFEPMINTPISWPGALVALAATLTIPTPSAHWPELASHPVTATAGMMTPTIPGLGVAAPSRSTLAAEAPASATERDDEIRIRHQTVCVGARHWAAGDVGDTILFRVHRDGHRLSVGYFVHWSTERPWGNNILSYTVLPALATDAVYSHFMFVMPGVKDYLYGPDDIEGARVDFEERSDGSLAVVGGTADDGTHDPVKLTPADLVDSKGRVVLLTNVWSHQLGAHGGGEFANGPDANLQCYGLPAVRRLTDDVARAFRLGSVQEPLRARPAWSALSSHP
jgi:hypothetical protein